MTKIKNVALRLAREAVEDAPVEIDLKRRLGVVVEGAERLHLALLGAIFLEL